jgi:hypothetical protein
MDNHIDQVENGTMVYVSERTRNKYGDESYRNMMSQFGKKGGAAGGGKNKLSEEIVSSRLKDYFEEFPERGKIGRLAKKWDCTETHARRFIKKHLPIGEQKCQNNTGSGIVLS